MLWYEDDKKKRGREGERREKEKLIDSEVKVKKSGGRGTVCVS